MRILSLLTAAIWVLGMPSDALAWGPATHIFLSGTLLGGVVGLGPATLHFLRRNRRDFYQGSVWADVLVGKKYAVNEAHCHSWQAAHALLSMARSDGQRAFALGYLGHLAADTVAHGYFVPRKLLLTRLPENVGHLYWELRADGLLDRQWWHQVEFRVREVSDHNRALLESVLEPTVFTFNTNRFLFGGQLASYRLERWYRLMAMAERNARWPLAGERIEAYHRESIGRMARIVTNPWDPSLTELDPTGGMLMRESVETRRNLRRLIRTGDLEAGTLDRVAWNMVSDLHLNAWCTGEAR